VTFQIIATCVAIGLFCLFVKSLGPTPEEVTAAGIEDALRAAGFPNDSDSLT